MYFGFREESTERIVSYKILRALGSYKIDFNWKGKKYKTIRFKFSE